jgi:hypothetical protein
MNENYQTNLFCEHYYNRNLWISRKVLAQGYLHHWRIIFELEHSILLECHLITRLRLVKFPFNFIIIFLINQLHWRGNSLNQSIQWSSCADRHSFLSIRQSNQTFVGLILYAFLQVLDLDWSSHQPFVSEHHINSWVDHFAAFVHR